MRVPVPTSLPPPVPMSPAAREALLAEAAAMERDASQGARLTALRRLIEGATILVDPGRAAIGRRVTIADDDGARESYSLVLPGDGNPQRGWVSIDSPVGTAVAGRCAGDRVIVLAPAGSWTARILAVAEPPYAGLDGR